MHLKPLKEDGRTQAEADPLIAVVGRGGVNLFNSQGNPWTADYLKICGQLEVDLRNNIAAEARAKITYENLIKYCDDPGSKEALTFLMTREVTYMKVFSIALESMEKGPPSLRGFQFTEKRFCESSPANFLNACSYSLAINLRRTSPVSRRQVTVCDLPSPTAIWGYLRSAVDRDMPFCRDL